MGFIYKITNKKNNKIYIGQTIKKRPSDRFSQHRYLANHLNQDNGVSYLHRAMNKDGVNNFIFEVIEEVDNILLNERECYWITYYNSKTPNGYNITNGGSGTSGYARPQTLEEKQKRQKSNKQFFKDHPEKIEEVKKRTTQLWQDEDYRKKVTEGVRKFYDEHPDMFKGKNNPFYGKKHTEESLKKIKEASKKRQLKIAKLDKETEKIITIYNGVKEAEKDLQVSHGWISKAARQNKVAYGFKWKFI